MTISIGYVWITAILICAGVSTFCYFGYRDARGDPVEENHAIGGVRHAVLSVVIFALIITVLLLS